eukprot:12009088-Prorocentrum_lima.AAC.1
MLPGTHQRVCCLEDEITAAQSMMGSRDTLAAQWGLAALLGHEPEYGGMRVAHEMLTTRIK